MKGKCMADEADIGFFTGRPLRAFEANVHCKSPAGEQISQHFSNSLDPQTHALQGSPLYSWRSQMKSTTSFPSFPKEDVVLLGKQRL